EFDQVGVEPSYFPSSSLPTPRRHPGAVPWSALAEGVSQECSGCCSVGEVDLRQASLADARRDSQANGHLVQGRAKVVDYLCRKHMDHLGWRFQRPHSGALTPGFGIWLGFYDWLAIAPEGGLVIFHLREQSLCALDFERWSKKRSVCHDPG